MSRLRVLAPARPAAVRPAAVRPGALIVVLTTLALAAASCTSTSASTAPGSGQNSGVNRARVSAVIASKVCRQPAPSSTPVRGSARQAAKTAAPAPAAVIRVDQVGYPAAAPKLAEIMAASMPGAGPRWVLVRAGTCAIAASGVASQNLGSWSKRYGWVWAVRFSGVRATGRYRIGLAGDPSVASPWFEIAPARQVYARPLANALSFYRN